jgi:hypothetical protein
MFMMCGCCLYHSASGISTGSMPGSRRFVAIGMSQTTSNHTTSYIRYINYLYHQVCSLLAGALVLPTGQLAVMNKNMMQVINPYTGEALAEAPALPDKVKDLVWE